LSGWPHFSGPNSSLSSFSTSLRYSRKTFHDVDHFGLDKIKEQLIEYLAAVHLKELNAVKEAAAITVACEEPAQQTETTTLLIQVNTSLRLHLLVSLLVVSLMKPKYVVPEVLMLYLVLDLSLKRSVKPHVFILSFFSTKLTKSDTVISIESFRCPSQSLEFVRRSV